MFDDIETGKTSPMELRLNMFFWDKRERAISFDSLHRFKSDIIPLSGFFFDAVNITRKSWQSLYGLSQDGVEIVHF